MGHSIFVFQSFRGQCCRLELRLFFFLRSSSIDQHGGANSTPEITGLWPFFSAPTKQTDECRRYPHRSSKTLPRRCITFFSFMAGGNCDGNGWPSLRRHLRHYFFFPLQYFGVLVQSTSQTTRGTWLKPGKLLPRVRSRSPKLYVPVTERPHL